MRIFYKNFKRYMLYLALIICSCDNQLTIDVPILFTIPIKNITYNSAESGGYSLAEYGYPILQKGVCYSTHESPTINDDTTNNGNGAANFVCIIRNLSPGTKYFLRAYATNIGGVGYGDERNFITDTIPAIVTITSGPEGITYDDTPTFSFIARNNDQTIASDINFYLKLDNYQTKSTKKNYYNFNTIEPGNHVLKIYAADSAGEQSDIVTREFEVLEGGMYVIELFEPQPLSVLDNGCSDADEHNLTIWDFDWEEIDVAEKYQFVLRAFRESNSSFNTWIDVDTITQSELHYEKSSYAGPLLIYWKVRAFHDGIWGNWSEEWVFTQEPVDTDCQ